MTPGKPNFLDICRLGINRFTVPIAFLFLLGQIQERLITQLFFNGVRLVPAVRHELGSMLVERERVAECFNRVVRGGEWECVWDQSD